MKHSQKRVCILTDSLGCPRKETIVGDTWTDKILRELSGDKYYFYTQCIHGLHSKIIPREYINEISPDIMIVQVGVVDACRRAMSFLINKVIRHIPIVSVVVNRVCRKYHYQITRVVNIHYSSIDDMKNAFLFFINHTHAKICIIPIAPAGKVMLEKIYNFDYDVNRYNQVMYDLEKFYPERVTVVNPYINYDVDTLFLSDGHHLNSYAIDLVYKTVKRYLDNIEGVK